MWQQRKQWADKFWPEIERVVRTVAGDIVDVQIASDHQDQKQATDYIVTVSSGDIACRVRNWEYWRRFGDFTIRWSVPSGITTEWEKIKAGYGRWYLYAWVRPTDKFGAWIFVDLDRLRDSGLLDRMAGPWDNYDGTTFKTLAPLKLYEYGCIVKAGGEAASRCELWSTMTPQQLELV